MNLPAWHDYALGIAFPAHGPKCEQYATDDYLTVEQCANGNVALGNCDIVADEIIEELHLNARTIYAFPLEDGWGNYHCAIVDDDGIVYDYTLRQYSIFAPFPFIGTADEWFIQLESYGSRWSWEDSKI